MYRHQDFKEFSDALSIYQGGDSGNRFSEPAKRVLYRYLRSNKKWMRRWRKVGVQELLEDFYEFQSVEAIKEEYGYLVKIGEKMPTNFEEWAAALSKFGTEAIPFRDGLIVKICTRKPGKRGCAPTTLSPRIWQLLIAILLMAALYHLSEILHTIKSWW